MNSSELNAQIIKRDHLIISSSRAGLSRGGGGLEREGDFEKTYLFAIHLDIGHIILKHGGHIDLGELIFAEDNQKASFTAGTVADNYQFLANRRHWKFCKAKGKAHWWGGGCK